MDYHRILRYPEELWHLNTVGVEAALRAGIHMKAARIGLKLIMLNNRRVRQLRNSATTARVPMMQTITRTAMKMAGMETATEGTSSRDPSAQSTLSRAEEPRDDNTTQSYSH
jgi:hypothetical protein